MSTANRIDDEASILARVLGDDRGQLPGEIARYILGLGFGDRDEARMHDLAVRHQQGALSPEEDAELRAFARVGSVLSILKSRAPRPP